VGVTVALAAEGANCSADGLTMDLIARSASMDWIETTPDQAYMKILWIGPEAGR
jgi:hypothetical protein